MIEQVMEDPIVQDPQIADFYDVIIIGAGPGGMTAALCAGRAKLKILLLDKAMPGGEMLGAYRVFNYPGFPDGILGADLANLMERHLMAYPITYICEYVEKIESTPDGMKLVKTNLNTWYRAKSIIIASGLEPRRLNAGFERQFLGRGVSYFAQCDAKSYENKTVAVIGGGNCACYAADYLTQYVDKLYLVHRHTELRAVKTVKDKILQHPKIDFMWNSAVTDVFGIDKVEKMRVENVVTNQHTWIDISCIFIYVGRIPQSNRLHPTLQCDEDGYIVTDDYMRTSVPGIYAIGDIRSKQIRQIATAVSDGMIAAINIERSLIR